MRCYPSTRQNTCCVDVSRCLSCTCLHYHVNKQTTENNDTYAPTQQPPYILYYIILYLCLNSNRTRIERKNSGNSRGHPSHAGRSTPERGTNQRSPGRCSAVLDGRRWKHRNRSHRRGGGIAADDLVGHAGSQCVPQFGQAGNCPAITETLYDGGTSHRLGWQPFKQFQ